jgi:hypothetical protein
MVSREERILAMNKEELNWLLQTIKDAADAERFVLAQYERGRISFQLMADIARKRGWVDRAANQFAITMTHYSNEYTRQYPTAIG